jgi:hypothetical protein
MKIESLTLENVGQIKKADITFGDLTVLVGAQATGKSIFLQFLKLMADMGAIQNELKDYGADWDKDLPTFLDLFLGEGMKSVWDSKTSRLLLNGNPQNLGKLVSRLQRDKTESLFLIPAQRVLTMRDGWPRPFSDYGPGDPFTVRYFSERLRRLMETELGRQPKIFPQTRRFKTEIRKMLESNVFGTFDLHIEKPGAQKRLVLGGRESSLPFMVWSAGQREFVPLLLGLYWLIPSTKVSRKEEIQWVVIEELEMGLHPKAIAVVLLLVLELISRDYKVCLSTHSPHVLDLVWAMHKLREHGAGPGELLSILEAEPTQSMKTMAGKALTKETRVYYFSREHGRAFDISSLDPGSEHAEEAGWGGLSEFSGRVNDIVARVVTNSHKGDPQ